MTLAEFIAFLANLSTLENLPQIATNTDELPDMADSLDDIETNTDELPGMATTLGTVATHTGELPTQTSLLQQIEANTANSTSGGGGGFDSLIELIEAIYGGSQLDEVLTGLGDTFTGVGDALAGGGVLAEGVGEMNRGTAELVLAGTEAHETNMMTQWGYAHIGGEHNDYVVMRPDMTQWGVVGTEEAVAGW